MTLHSNHTDEEASAFIRRAVEGGVDDLQHYMEATSRLAQERDDLATSNRINQDALKWVKGVVMDDDMPAIDRMATLRHHFERGTFPVELLMRRET